MTTSSSKHNAKFDDPSTWPHAPVYFCPGPSMTHVGDDDSRKDSLPLGVAVPFETNLFHGKVLFRIRDIPAAHQDEHKKYFSERKRLYQVVIQGQFQRDKISFADLFIGARYDRPFTGIPLRKSIIMKSIQSFIKRLTPGMLFDIAADKPRVMAPMGTCQRMCVRRKGEEPDIMNCTRGIEEDTQLMFEQEGGNDEKNFSSPNDRRKRLADPSCSSKFTVDPSLVYTFEIYDHTIDFSKYKQHFGGFVKVKLSNKLSGQPLTLTSLLVPQKHEEGDGDRYKNEEVVYDFQVWHKELLDKSLISYTRASSTDPETTSENST
jgi:hypothetical protein